MAYNIIVEDNSVYINKNFVLFLISQGVSNLGDAFHLIAVTSLLVKITGSGLSAAFGLVCGPVLSFLLSAFAGYISDAKNEKFLIVLIDLLRGLVVILFIAKRNIIEIYLLVIMLSALDVFYNPPRRKFLTGILRNNRLITGNSLLNGLSGAMFILGPIIAGIIISNYGTNIAFLVNSVSFFISSFCVMLIKYKPDISGKIKTAKRSIISLYEGSKYCIKNYTLCNAILTGTVICFSTTSVNLAFYPFAFDVLKVSDKIWGLMMSTFYGASLIAMPVTLLIDFNIKTFYKVIIPVSLIIISIIWFSYGNTHRLNYILMLQLLEGTILTFINIVLTSYLQTKSKKDILGRVIGINDFLNNLGKIIGIVFTYALLEITKPSNVFLFCSMIMITFAFYTAVSTKGNILKEL